MASQDNHADDNRNEGLTPQTVLHATWQLWPTLRWSFMHMDKVVPTTVVLAAPEPIPLGCTSADSTETLLRVPIRSDYDWDTTVYDVMEQTGTDSLIVMHEGRVVAEKYFRGTENTPHIVQAKLNLIIILIIIITK